MFDYNKQYRSEKMYFMVYPTIETAMLAYLDRDAQGCTRTRSGTASVAEAYRSFYSKKFAVDVPYLSPGTVFSVVSVHGDFAQILQNGKMGWIYLWGKKYDLVHFNEA